MYAKRELGYFVRAMIGQLRGGCESLAHGPLNSAENLSASPIWSDVTFHTAYGRRPYPTTLSGAVASIHYLMIP